MKRYKELSVSIVYFNDVDILETSGDGFIIAYPDLEGWYEKL